MHATTTLSLLALIGSALAIPAPRAGQPVVVYETEVVTVVVTAQGSRPTGQGRPHHTYQPRPKPETTVVYTTEDKPKPTSAQPTPSKEPTYAPAPEEPTTTEQPQPTYTPEPEKPTTTSEAPQPSSPPANSGYMGTVNTWRSKLGLKDLEHSDQMESNAANTCDEGNGQMVHKLNPGTMGQVLAPGECQDSAFEHVFVGGWLCELPNMPGMDGVCAEQSKGWTYQGQTGHAEILTADRYSKIGCSCKEGIWGCDLS
jgi:hypothetical protein